MIDATNRTKHYAPGPHRLSPERLPARIEAAYRAAGLTPPARRSAVDEALREEPTADELARALALEALDVDDKSAPKWTRDALTRLQRAAAADTLRTALARYAGTAVKAHTKTMTARALSDLAGTFAQAVDTLTAAAAVLPPEPFDLAAVVDLDATRAAREAGQALTLMARCADVLPAVSGASVGPAVAGVLAVVDVPEVTPEDVDRMTRRPLDSDDPDAAARAEVRRFFHDVDRRGADAALVDVARGRYGDRVRLSLADSAAEQRARLERAEAAVSRRVVDSWGYKGKRSTVRA